MTSECLPDFISSEKGNNENSWGSRIEKSVCVCVCVGGDVVVTWSNINANLLVPQPLLHCGCYVSDAHYLPINVKLSQSNILSLSGLIIHIHDESFFADRHIIIGILLLILLLT